jgi:hypothetical protein
MGDTEGRPTIPCGGPGCVEISVVSTLGHLTFGGEISSTIYQSIWKTAQSSKTYGFVA